MSGIVTRIARTTGLLMLGFLMAVAGGWGALALAYSGPATETVRTSLAVAFGVATLVAVLGLLFRRWRGRALVVYGLMFAVLLIWWSGIEPSNERDWQTDVAVLPKATIEGDLITVHNIRNFDYRSETDYTPAYYDRRFDLRKLEGVDLVAVYWMGPAIAHVFLSFAFDDGEHLAISIETRKEKGEAYSTLKGFFRQYELYYVVGDERDLIRLRTNYRHDPPEDVYVYRLQGSLEDGRRLFREYMHQINSLNATPEFYNTLTTNCTTNIWLNSRVNAEHLPFSWKILASGYVPEYLHEHGRLANGDQPFAVIQQRAHVNSRAHAADMAADFSRRIRAAVTP
ncbi:MAG: DUF4105 domain-containing protein [Azoarcus sp.]|nr:DUF4105 domain-containing protein [Azoarcus sp.]